MIVEYIVVEFVALDEFSKSLQIDKNLIIKVDEYNPKDIYSLAFLPIIFEQNEPSSFQFEIIHLQCNIVFGCMIVYIATGHHIKKLLQKQRNDSFQGNYIGSAPNGYSYDSSGLLIHNNAIIGMNSKLETGTIFTIKHNPKESIIQFYVDGILQEYNFTNVILKKCQKLIGIIGLTSKSECIKCISFNIL